jgi:glycosyltransferase involved in cell wall biosynthesis
MMKRKKLVYIISNIDKALAFEWIAMAEKLQAMCAIHFVLLNEKEGYLYRFLLENGHAVRWISYRGKKDMPSAIWQLYRYLKQEKADIVHTHLFDAGVAGLLAAIMARVPKRIYTRHHATMHHTYYPRAVYYDRFINSLASKVVAISKNVEEVLITLEHVPDKKVVLIHHGFDLSLFHEVSQDRILAVVTRHAIPLHAAPRIGVISRYIHLKGIDYIIEAFERVQQVYPQAHLILANARGDYQNAIRAQLQELKAGSYTEIEFEQDLPALYKTFDVYVHTPIDAHSEAFGQTYVEALAAGVPSVFTLSGVATEFVRDRENALVVSFKNGEEIANAILELQDKPSLRNRLIEHGRVTVQKAFGLEKMIDNLVDLYEE